MVVLLLLYTTSIHGFVDGSMVGGGVWFTLRGDISAGLDGYPLGSFTTGSTLRAGESGWVMPVGNVV